MDGSNLLKSGKYDHRSVTFFLWLIKELFADAPENVIVVDTSNYYPFRDEDIKELKNGKIESEWVAEQIGRPVIKAFNNLLAHSLEHGGKSEDAEGRLAMAISGDEDKAKAVVSGLINDAGPPSHEEIVLFNRSLFPRNPKTA